MKPKSEIFLAISAYGTELHLQFALWGDLSALPLLRRSHDNEVGLDLLGTLRCSMVSGDPAEGEQQKLGIVCCSHSNHAPMGIRCCGVDTLRAGASPTTSAASLGSACRSGPRHAGRGSPKANPRLGRSLHRGVPARHAAVGDRHICVDRSTDYHPIGAQLEFFNFAVRTLNLQICHRPPSV